MPPRDAPDEPIPPVDDSTRKSSGVQAGGTPPEGMKPSVLIVSPGLEHANNGNWQTARRWAGILAPHYEVEISDGWYGSAPDLLIALHAHRSAEAIESFTAAYPGRPVVVVLTGTDVYRDIHRHPTAAHVLTLAQRLVVLQPQAKFEIDPWLRHKVEVIYQSAAFEARHEPRRDAFEIVCVGHLRREKDPITLMQAAHRLPPTSMIRIVQIGRALDAEFERAAESAHGLHYTWIGELSHHATRELIRRARALVTTSRIEGGANVIVEAVMSDVRVLASHISGNLGMLGQDYDGYFSPGDPDDLARLLLRTERDHAFRRHLKAQCHARRPLFEPERERDAVLHLIDSVLAHTQPTPA